MHVSFEIQLTISQDPEHAAAVQTLLDALNLPPFRNTAATVLDPVPVVPPSQEAALTDGRTASSISESVAPTSAAVAADTPVTASVTADIFDAAAAAASATAATSAPMTSVATFAASGPSNQCTVANPDLEQILRSHTSSQVSPPGNQTNPTARMSPTVAQRPLELPARSKAGAGGSKMNLKVVGKARTFDDNLNNMHLKSMEFLRAKVHTNLINTLITQNRENRKQLMEEVKEEWLTCEEAKPQFDELVTTGNKLMEELNGLNTSLATYVMDEVVEPSSNRSSIDDLDFPFFLVVDQFGGRFKVVGSVGVGIDGRDVEPVCEQSQNIDDRERSPSFGPELGLGLCGADVLALEVHLVADLPFVSSLGLPREPP
ncbi:hypothetical protein K488DRAFT_90227 [Vararia minispora EC-137]|uniref:Uncharacterized protein n=1 Tax=Vararia minispora EC-137 TaxID=1314806 RepID=A0ACB8Q876_9AGAM|nr:hypothetical protein K488DRAFT_90227 [Vararia minispora EC-137]